MKSLATYFILSCLALPTATCQTYSTVNKVELTGPVSQSFVVNRHGQILPQTIIKGSSGVFFLRANAENKGIPSPEKNSVRIERFFQKEKEATKLSAIVDKEEVYKYFDGLGKNIQTVIPRSGPTGKASISFLVYDMFGRQTRKHLPYAADGRGEFRPEPLVEQTKFYQSTPGVAVDAEPYTMVEFDDSPMNEIKKSFAVGWNWHNDAASRPATSTMLLNNNQEVYHIEYSGSGVPQVSMSKFYPANSLLVSQTTDEAGLIRKKFRNSRGHIVLDRAGSGSVWHDTYHVYDEGGKLMVVFPPEATARLSEYVNSADKQLFLDTWCFLYKYDHLDRVSDKKIPGGGWIYMIYDNWDRLVLVQDANQRASNPTPANEWSYTKYDMYNRPILSGLITGGRSTLENNVRNATSRYETRLNNSIGYTNTCFPSHSTTNLTSITYYDDYDFKAYTVWDAERLSYSVRVEEGIINSPDAVIPAARGLVTGSKVKVLDQSKWLNSVTYYDNDYREVQTLIENHLGKLDVISTLFSLAGLPERRKLSHSTNFGSLTVVEDTKYDHARRLLSVHHSINGGQPVLMLSHKYNELGQLIEKNVHSTDEGATFLQSVDFRYNIHGWLTHINNSTLTKDGTTNDDTNDLFGMELMFNKSLTMTNATGGKFYSQVSYNGNVSAVKWKSNTKQPGVVALEKAYGFKNDIFSRFKEANYATKSGSSWSGNAGTYNESASFYDKNGNIGGGTTVGLIRFGLSNGVRAIIDHLAYRYHGNKLLNVTDESGSAMGFVDNPGAGPTLDEFSYDNNGNLISDLNKGITGISYNHLGLPKEITVSRILEGVVKTDIVRYVYDAKGSRLSKEVVIDGVPVWKTDYVGQVQYERAGTGNPGISFLRTSEGRAVFNDGKYEHEYFFKDHQNNIRLVYGLKKETLSYLATMEPALETRETGTSAGQFGFENVKETRTPGTNKTAPSELVLNPDYAARCNAGTGNAVGPVKKLRVGNGDAVYMEVFARYDNVVTSSNVLAPALLGSYVAAAFGITAGENAVLFTNVSAGAGSLSVFPDGALYPNAYLAYLFFDDNLVLDESKSGAVSLTTDGYNTWQKLVASFTADKSGYLYVYVANGSTESPADAYFDDLYIIHEKNNQALQVVQASDYYPFGLSFNTYNADRLRVVKRDPEPVYEPVPYNRILFQDQELQKEFGVDWYQFKYRMHDPAIGRFSSIDPLAEDYKHNSTYAFSENKLMHGRELEGREFDQVFNLMKHFSFTAVKPTLAFSSHEARLGMQVSIGLPKILPFSYRKSYGFSFNLYDILEKKPAFTTNSGTETSYAFGLYSFQDTKLTTNGATSQVTGMFTVGLPFLNAEYENDWFGRSFMKWVDPFGFHPNFGGDGGDRFRTAAARLNLGPFTIGTKLGTGDPGPLGHRKIDASLGGKQGTYIPQTFSGTNYNPNSFRLGLLYGGIGPLRVGVDDESIRHSFQNVLVHDNLSNSPWFQVQPSRPELYIGFDFGSTTQW
jgi:RHS repeat-associated protein